MVAKAIISRSADQFGIFRWSMAKGREFGAWWMSDAEEVFYIHWPTVELLAATTKVVPDYGLPLDVKYARMLIAVRDGTAIIADKPG